MENLSQLSIEEIKRRLISKYNVEEDELKVLGFDTDEKIREYYSQLALQAKSLETEDEAEVKGAPADTYELSAKQKGELKSWTKKVKKEEKDKKLADFSQKAAPNGPSFSEAQAAVTALNAKPTPKVKGVFKPKKKG